MVESARTGETRPAVGGVPRAGSALVGLPQRTVRSANGYGGWRRAPSDAGTANHTSRVVGNLGEEGPRWLARAAIEQWRRG